jgi:hypothetical protein
VESMLEVEGIEAGFHSFRSFSIRSALALTVVGSSVNDIGEEIDDGVWKTEIGGPWFLARCWGSDRLVCMIGHETKSGTSADSILPWVAYIVLLPLWTIHLLTSEKA